MKRAFLAPIALSAVLLALGGCGYSPGQRALSGGAIGAGTGALIGGGAGALTGAATTHRQLNLGN